MEILSVTDGRKIWMTAQGLHAKDTFGLGPSACEQAVDQLGYVQIDTINVIERCHHHILFTRVSNYKNQFLHQLQTKEKSIYEYWGHALAYLPTKDYRFGLRRMKVYQNSPDSWLSSVTPEEMKKVVRLIRTKGPITLREIGDDQLVEKDHLWSSRKPSQKALQLGFHSGKFVISERIGILKKYDFTERHFAWEKKPKIPTEAEYLEYLLRRALKSQGIISLNSASYMKKSPVKNAIKKLIAQKVKSGELLPVQLQGLEKIDFWMDAPSLENKYEINEDLVHILSPFDPLVIQRDRLAQFFKYEHRFEAYLPPEKRIFGYFGLPVMIGDSVVAVLDLKADRIQKKILIQKWTWLKKTRWASQKTKIEEALSQFHMFQFQVEER